MCKHIVYTTSVNFQMNIVYRRKIKNRKKKKNAYAYKTSEAWPIFRVCTKLDLQVFSQMSKTMKKLQRIPILTWTPAHLFWVFIYLLTSKLMLIILAKESILDAWLNSECAFAGELSCVLKVQTEKSSWQQVKMESV